MDNLLFCVHILCMSHVINTFYWLLPQSVVNNYCVLCRVNAKKETKAYNSELCRVLKPFSSINYEVASKFVLVDLPTQGL